jgi:hypothetical protein
LTRIVKSARRERVKQHGGEREQDRQGFHFHGVSVKVIFSVGTKSKVKAMPVPQARE